MERPDIRCALVSFALLSSALFSGAAHADANFFGDPAEYMVQGNPKAAARNLRAAVDKGEPAAMVALAHLYRSGTGVERDMAASTGLYRRAAERGHIDAQYITGICYARGRGVEKDLTEARFWFDRAVRAGHPTAGEWIARLEQSPSASGPVQIDTLVSDGQVAAVVASLESGSSLEAVDSQGTPILHLAVLNHQTEVVEILLKRNVDLDASDAAGNTALHLAAANNEIELYGVLLNAGADPDRPNGSGWTAGQLHDRTSAGESPSEYTSKGLDSKQRLAAYQADPRFAGWSVLSVAAWHSDDENVRGLIARGDSLGPDSMGFTPLDRAVQNGTITTVEVLLALGGPIEEVTDVTEVAEGAESLVLLGVNRGDADILALLLANSAPLDARGDDGVTALHTAILDQREDLAGMLLEAGADPAIADPGGVTALMMVAHEGHAGLVGQIVRSGVDLDATDDDARSALHYAASGCEPGVFDPLAAMLPLAADANGRWPLHDAAESGCVELVDRLLDRGHALDPVSTAGNTPLALAAAHGFVTVVEPLAARGADCNLRDLQGETALHRAVRGGHLDTVSALLKAGANPSIRNNNELNAFDLSADSATTVVLNADRPSLFATFE